MAVAVSVAVLFLAVAVYVLCEFFLGRAQPPSHRPKGVPLNAVWAGGLDGGSYFLCVVDKEKRVNPCTVWNEETGSVIVSGDFWVSGQDRAAIAEELKYGWYDGHVIGLQVLTSEKRYMTLERVEGIRPLTLCEVLAKLGSFQGKAVAVLGRLDVTNEGKTLRQLGCQNAGGGDSSLHQVRVIETTDAPQPPMGRLYLNEKSVREKLAMVKGSTNLDYVRPAPPLKVFRSWAVVYGRVQSARDSGGEAAVTLVSSGNGIEFVFDR